MGPRPGATAPGVRSFTQYKYAAGVRNPQQHLNTQPPVAMQQVLFSFLIWAAHVE